MYEKKRPDLFFITLTLVFSTAGGENQSSLSTIKIMSFNIKIFGAAKMAKPEDVKTLVDLVSQADIIAVQEVRSVIMLGV
jgi:Holliday junction resolvasome RuvABC ATP-dependent DNA helicase subunit